MSNLELSKQQQIQLKRLAQEAEKSLLGSSALPLVLGGATFAMLNFVGLPVALLAASPFLWSAFKNAHRNGLNAEYMAKTGLFAHSLSAEQLIRLTRIIGKDAVVSQLLAAHEDQKPFSGDALDYMEMLGYDLEPVQDLKAFLVSHEDVAPAIDVTGVPVEPSTPVGFSTPDPAEPSLAAPKMYSPVDAIVPDDGTIKSTLIVGVPGAGKGMVVSNAIQKLRAVRPDLRIFVADPKASEKESGYWSWLPKGQLIREPMLEASPEDKEAWLFDAIDHFQLNCKGNGLLVIDELTILVNSLSQKGRSKFGDKIVSISSGGDSEGLYLWGIAQTASAKSLGLGDGSIRSVLKGIAIIGGDNAGAIKAVRRTDFVSHVDDLELTRLRKKSQVDRAWYDGVTNKWYPMPALPNLSGYDRDTRTRIGAKPEVQPQGQQPQEIQELVIDLIDSGLDAVGVLQAGQLKGAIKKKFQKDLLLKDVERFLVNLVQVWPKKYELISAGGSVSIQRRNLTGASDTQTTGYQRSSQQLTEQPRVPAAGA